MTVNELLYVLTLAVLGSMLSLFTVARRHEARCLALFFLGSFGFRVALVFLNGHFNFFSQKHASVLAWQLTNQKGGPWAIFGSDIYSLANFAKLKFFPEGLLNAPALALFENSLIMLNLTNSFVGAMAGIATFAYTSRLFDRRIAIFTLLIVSFLPVAINFSLFGLRDIIIYFFLLTEIFSFGWLVLRRDFRFLNASIFVISVACAAVLRMAFLPFLLVLPAWFFLAWVLRSLRGVRDRRRRWMLCAAAGAVLLASGGGIIFGSYMIVLRHVGIGELVTPDVLLDGFAKKRAWKGYDPAHAQTDWLKKHRVDEYSPYRGQAAASAYLPARVYRRLPWLARAAVQVVGFIVIPFPWQLNAAARVLAMFDSIIVMFCMYGAWRTHQTLRLAARGRGPPLSPSLRSDTLSRFSFALFLTFILSWLGFALLVSNSGNAFRMRLSVVPFIVLGASIRAASAPWAVGRVNRVLRAMFNFGGPDEDQTVASINAERLLAASPSERQLK